MIKEVEKQLKCPHCGSAEIEEDDCINTEYNSTTIAKRLCGRCTNCEALLEWEEVFVFSNYQNVEICG